MSWAGNVLGTTMESVYQIVGVFTVLAILITSIALRRKRSKASVLLLWAMVAAHVILGANVLLTEFCAVLVVYSIARSAPKQSFVALGVSIPLAAITAVLLMRPTVWVWILSIDAENALWSSPILLFWIPFAAVLIVGGVPYVIGAYLRSRGEVAQSAAALVETRAELAETSEIARLRADQARLARDVHDVVGHSLAVIIAQAEAARLSGQLAPAGSAALSHIADVARESLQDVRAVLASTGDSTASVAGRVGELDELIDGVRAAGYAVDAHTLGHVQPLPPEIEAVAYRSLQEMLTNALRHGSASHPVSVRQSWDNEVLIEVRNRVADAPSAVGGGAGIASMEGRLESVGGELDAYLDGDDFVARVRLPLRAVHV